jgi:hypothetical protein
MLAAMEAAPTPRAWLRAIWIFALSAATLYWAIQVVAPVAETWAARAAGHLEAARPLSYFERRDPAACPGTGADRVDCVEQASVAERDWVATRRAFQKLAWDIDLFVWSSLINLGVGFAPLLIVWANARRSVATAEAELY